MKVHTKIVIDLTSGEVLEDEYYEYDGPLALAGGSPSGPPEHTTQTQEPWDEQKPFLIKGFERGEEQFQKPVEFFGGSTVVPYSPESQFAFAGQTQRAMEGSPLMFLAQNELVRMLSGSYLPGMPFQSPQVAQSLASRAPAPAGGKGQGEPGAPLPDTGDPGSNPFPTPATFGPVETGTAPGEPNLPPPGTPPPPGAVPAPAPEPTGTPKLGDVAAGPPGGGLPAQKAPPGTEWENIGHRHYRLVVTDDFDDFGDNE